MFYDLTPKIVSRKKMDIMVLITQMFSLFMIKKKKKQ